MPLIELTTFITAPLQRCFDLSRSIDLHQISTANTKEKAIAGKTSGLIGMNEFVTWEAVHFGIKQCLTSKITAFEYPVYFRDEQVSGPFAFLKHDHYFQEIDGAVMMKDAFQFKSPLGILGSITDRLILKKYLENLLLTRNSVIKSYAESEQWKLAFVP